MNIISNVYMLIIIEPFGAVMDYDLFDGTADNNAFIIELMWAVS